MVAAPHFTIHRGPNGWFAPPASPPALCSPGTGQEREPLPAILPQMLRQPLVVRHPVAEGRSTPIGAGIRNRINPFKRPSRSTPPVVLVGPREVDSETVQGPGMVLSFL